MEGLTLMCDVDGPKTQLDYLSFEVDGGGSVTAAAYSSLHVNGQRTRPIVTVLSDNQCRDLMAWLARYLHTEARD